MHDERLTLTVFKNPVRVTHRLLFSINKTFNYAYNRRIRTPNNKA